MTDPGQPFRTGRRGRLVPRCRVIGRSGPAKAAPKYDEDGDPGAALLNRMRTHGTRPARPVEEPDEGDDE
jgi:hypothetical protein